jgi:nucleotide-binding universal stress UspA family protein
MTTESEGTRPTIVVGCGDSPAARAALTFAAREAELRGARLRVVLAFQPDIDPDVPAWLPSDVLAGDRALAVAKALCDEVLGLPHGAPETDIVVEQGVAAHVLVAAAKDADLLVIGARRRGFLARVAHLTTTRHVLHHARVPVVVVPAPAAEEG